MTRQNYEAIISFAQAFHKKMLNTLPYYLKVEGGTYEIGQGDHSINPSRKITIKPFEISRYEITNKQFEKFINRTGFLTLAERRKDAFVFMVGLDEFEWIQDSTANWRFPNGISRGGIENKMDHPVTCISYIDALAYCRWAKVRLPTSDEWEVASRGKAKTRPYFFGDTPSAISEYANVWKGQTHLMKYSNEDFLTTSPVGSYKPNSLGLYDIYGNVFEFCYDVPHTLKNLTNIAVARGGSWWCSLTACSFFNSVDIGRVQKEASFSNNGFRIVR